MKAVKGIKLWCMALCLVVGSAGLASADQLLIQTTQNTIKSTSYNTPFTLVQVGNSDVTISKFGVYGEATSAINLEWLIFDVINPTVNTTPPVYNSGSISVAAATSYQWYDNAIPGNFVLAANHTYGMGLIANTASSFSYGTASSGSAITQNGLTIRFEEPLTAPGAFMGGSGAPYLWQLSVDAPWNRTSLEVFSPSAVPIPPTALLFGSGLLGLVGLRRFRKS